MYSAMGASLNLTQSLLILPTWAFSSKLSPRQLLFSDFSSSSCSDGGVRKCSKSSMKWMWTSSLVWSLLILQKFIFGGHWPLVRDFAWKAPTRHNSYSSNDVFFTRKSVGFQSLWKCLSKSVMILSAWAMDVVLSSAKRFIISLKRGFLCQKMNNLKKIITLCHLKSLAFSA